MKKKSLILLGIILIVGLMGCASVAVRIDYDESANFGDYSTFRFVRPQRQQGRGTVRNQFLTREILQEIKPIMVAKGLTEAASENDADLLVVFYAMVQNRRSFSPPSYRVGRFGRVWRTRPGHVVNYKEGTLVIDMVDNRAKELVWQGVGTGVLGRSDPAGNFREAVEKILEKYPPQ